MRMNKYHNRKLNTPDGLFDSKKEYQRWLELRRMEENGEIFDLTRQKKYELVPKHKRADGSTERACYYIADFVYWELGAGEPELTVEDVKGMKTPLYNLKRKLMLDRYGITIHEVR